VTEGIEVTPSNYKTVVSGASPGAVLLLRAGTYSDDVKVPAGSSGSPIVLKPFNRGQVTITGQLTLSSFNVLGGVTINRPGKQYALFIDQKDSTPKTDIEVRYCNVFGGSTEAIRLSRNVRNIQIHHCLVDGGENHHNLLSIGGSAEGSSWAPTNVEIHHNVFTKARTGGGNEDGIQLNGWGYHRIHHNNFRDIPNENGIDIKAPHGSARVDIEFNYFKGKTISEAMILLHAGPRAVQNVRNNHFDGSSNSSSVHSIMLGGTSAAERVNFVSNTVTNMTKRISLRYNDGTVIEGNNIQGGTLRLGQSDGPDPKNLIVSRNHFNGVKLDADSSVTYIESVGNVLTNVSGNWSPIGQ